MTGKRSKEGPLEPGRFNYEGLDRVLHEKARLGILVSLCARPDGLLFGELKGLCSLTDGNLNRHLEVLSDAGLIEIHKGFAGKRPQTRIQLTPTGRRRFLDYLAELERVLHDALPAADAHRSPRPRPGLDPA